MNASAIAWWHPEVWRKRHLSRLASSQPRQARDAMWGAIRYAVVLDEERGVAKTCPRHYKNETFVILRRNYRITTFQCFTQSIYRSISIYPSSVVHMHPSIHPSTVSIDQSIDFGYYPQRSQTQTASYSLIHCTCSLHGVWHNRAVDLAKGKKTNGGTFNMTGARVWSCGW